MLRRKSATLTMALGARLMKLWSKVKQKVKQKVKKRKTKMPTSLQPALP